MDNFPKTEVGSGKSGAPVQTLENLEMKKTLVAIAALAATGAFAQSSVAITGVFDAGYQAISHTDDTKKWSGIKNNATNTSRFDFQGTEDLGAGLKASFWAELDINPVQSTTTNLSSASSASTFTGTPFTGQQFVGIAGGFGDLKIGQPNSPALDIGGGVLQPFGTALGSGYSGTWGRMGTQSGDSGINSFVGGSTGRIVRHEKTAVYTTPVLNGFKAQFEYSAKNGNSGDNANAANGSAASNDNGYQSISATYSNGPLNFAALSATAKAGSNAAVGVAGAAGATGTASLAANQDVKWTMFGGNYTVGALTGYVGYTTTKSSQAVNAASTVGEDSKSANYGVKYVMGNIDLLANTTTRTSNLADVAGYSYNGSFPKSTNNALGANYNLSKTTFVYYRYESIKNVATALSAPAAVGTSGAAVAGQSTSLGQNQTTNAIGLVVKF
jgi:predicted porin